MKACLNWCLVPRYLLLTAILMSAVTPQDCNDGWFQTQCLLQCHCKSTTCELRGGACPFDVRCSSGYFGPGCQYENIAFTEGDSSNPMFLQDENENTCNNDIYSTSLSLKLARPHKTIWFRLQLNILVTIGRLIVKLEDSENLCTNMNAYIIDNQTLDFVCEHVVYANLFTVEGPVASHVCSIIVSGGRNVAIKQRTEFSQHYFGNSGLAFNAVDGRTDTETYHCIHTWHSVSGSWWTMKFYSPYVIHRVVIFNNIDHLPRLSGFKLITFNVNGGVNEEYFSPIKDEDIYHVPLGSDKALTGLKIEQHILPPHALNRSLNFCEVQTYSHARGFKVEDDTDDQITAVLNTFNRSIIIETQQPIYK